MFEQLSHGMPKLPSLGVYRKMTPLKRHAWIILDHTAVHLNLSPCGNFCAFGFGDVDEQPTLERINGIPQPVLYALYYPFRGGRFPVGGYA